MGQHHLEGPWSVVATDIIGPKPASKGGVRYVLVFVDLFTKYVELIGLRKANSKAVVKAMDELIINRWGCPRYLVTDNGTKFANKDVGRYLESLGVEQTTIPPYIARCNPTERVNRNLRSMIASYIEEDQTDWDLHLQELNFDLNTAHHASIGTAPSFLNFGRHPLPALQLRKDTESPIEEVCLAYPDPMKPYYLQTEASNFANNILGVTLSQMNDDNVECPITFISRTLKGAELAYNTTEKELLAENLQTGDKHPRLFEHSIVKGVVKSLKTRNQFRNVTFTLSKELHDEYMDEENNFVFHEYYLEESQGDVAEIAQAGKETQGKVIHSIAKDMILEKFHGKNCNAEAWMKLFVLECTRLNINENRFSEVLRLFLEGSASEWFSSFMKTNSLARDWEDWSNSFVDTFVQKSWSEIAFAYSFKYLNGSYLDFALKKINLLIDVDPELTIESQINLIVIGLPGFVRSKIDKKNIVKVEDLMAKLRQLEPVSNKFNRRSVEKQKNDDGSRGQMTRREIMELYSFPDKYGIFDDIPEDAAKLFFLQHLYKKNSWQRPKKEIYGSKIRGGPVGSHDRGLFYHNLDDYPSNFPLQKVKALSADEIRNVLDSAKQICDSESDDEPPTMLEGLPESSDEDAEEEPVSSDNDDDEVEQNVSAELHNKVCVTPPHENANDKDIFERSVRVCADASTDAPVVRADSPVIDFCVDYRDLNKVTKKDGYPCKNMDTILDRLRRARYISKIDLKSAYHQVCLDEDSKAYTVFSVRDSGQYQFLRLPFRLKCAPTTFQRLMDSLFGAEVEPYVFAYLDDIILVTETFEEHVSWLERVIRILLDAKLVVNRDKCEFCCQSVKFLGYMLDSSGLRIDSERVRPIHDYPLPRNVKQVKRLLGMVGWYSRFIKNEAEIKVPLARLLRKDAPFVWGADQEQAFETLKQSLSEAPVLVRPDFEKEFSIQTDSSDYAISAVFTQEREDGEQSVYYISRVLTSAERNYTVTEKECLAVIWAIEKFRPYVEGYHFKVVADHRALSWLRNFKDTQGRVARWALKLMEYDFEIVYRKGSLHYVPDALSRAFECEERNEFFAFKRVEDEWYMKKLSEVKKSPSKFPNWCIEDGMLYKRSYNALLDPVSNAENSWRLLVPAEQRERVLAESHCLTSSGHLGAKKTYDRLACEYWWPGMWYAVEEYCNSCDVCQRYKVPQTGPKGLMTRRVVDRPWAVVAADMMEFPRSKNQNKYLLVFQDLFTRWIEIVPLRKANGMKRNNQEQQRRSFAAVVREATGRTTPSVSPSTDGRVAASSSDGNASEEARASHQAVVELEEYVRLMELGVPARLRPEPEGHAVVEVSGELIPVFPSSSTNTSEDAMDSEESAVLESYSWQRPAWQQRTNADASMELARDSALHRQAKASVPTEAESR
uniref:RNA-directed DNA polymerase n=1 Tax=Trichogramma kaykai TaxID=54128 RepID=A0ABD2WZX6_9HYME